MLNHLIFTVIVDVCALCIMGMITSQNQLISKKTRDKFNFTYFVIGFISVMELVTMVVNGLDSSYRLINIVSNYLGFALTPFVPLLFAYSINDKGISKIVVVLSVIYAILVAVSIPYGLIFYVDARNIYSRGPLFWTYIFTYLVNVAYYFYLIFNTSKKYQNRNVKMILIMMTFFIIGTSIQLIDQELRLTWMTITLLSFLNYVYFNTMWQQLDGLTGLLNQHSYLKALEYNDHSGIMIFMDVDGFKHINDSYGHKVGNEVLVKLSNMILETYGRYGSCYRMGGDEFVLLLESDTDCDILNKQLQEKIRVQKNIYAYFPNVSIGMAKYHADDDLNRIFAIADDKMYKNKHK